MEMLFLKVFREKDLGLELQQIYSFSNGDLDTFKLEAPLTTLAHIVDEMRVGIKVGLKFI